MNSRLIFYSALWTWQGESWWRLPHSCWRLLEGPALPRKQAPPGGRPAGAFLVGRLFLSWILIKSNLYFCCANIPSWGQAQCRTKQINVQKRKSKIRSNNVNKQPGNLIQEGPRIRVMRTNLLHVELDGKWYKVLNVFPPEASAVAETAFKVKAQSGIFAKGSKGEKCEGKRWRFMAWYLARSATHPTTQLPLWSQDLFIHYVISRPPGTYSPPTITALEIIQTHRSLHCPARYPLSPGSRVHVWVKCLT